MLRDRKLRVLHADDDDSFRILLERALAAMPDLKERCSIATVPDGTDAVDYVLGRAQYADRVAHPMPDLVILDQRMNRMDGLEALRAIRADARASRVVICIFSTSTQDSLLNASMAHGATFCIEKPLEFEKLGPKMRLMFEFALDVLELPRNRPESFFQVGRAMKVGS